MERVECKTEKAAIEDFFRYLKTVGGPADVVLVGLDEDTVGVLVQKLKAVSKNKFRKTVAGFTWWNRILKHTNFKHK